MKENVKTFKNTIESQLQEVKRRTKEVSKMIDQMERYLEDVDNAKMLGD